jgi:cytidine deaminase
VHKRNGEEGINGKTELMQAAEEAMKKAYAPYSGFKVGAAVQLDDGRIILDQTRKMQPILQASVPKGLHCFTAASQFPEKKIKQ